MSWLIKNRFICNEKSKQRIILHDVSQADACTRGMGDDLTKWYRRYVVVDDKTVGKKILCDTETLGGGWIVIQVRATPHNERVELTIRTFRISTMKELN